MTLADELDGEEEDEEKQSLFEKIQAAFPLLMAWLYRHKDFTYESMTDEEVQSFVRKVSDYFDHAVDTSIRQVPMAEVSVQRLKESNYVFSGIKVFHELNEAFPSMLDDNNELRPFEDFLNDVQKINNTYNGSYLKTEYNFARQSSLAAARWKQFEKDGDRYNLQYRTAYDDRVRTSHRKLEGITLPPSSKFWNDYFPPNGWNCFVAGTKVLMSGGEWKPIEKVLRGDIVVGGSGQYQLVEGTHVNSFDGELVRIITKRGHSTSTPNHRYLTSKGWVDAASIKTGDILVQVGKTGLFNKAINAIHNMYTLGRYGLMLLKRKWKMTRTKTINSKI